MDGLVRVTRGVWRPHDAVSDLKGRAAALLSAVPDGTVIGGVAAARVHGLWLPSNSEQPIELLLRRDAPDPSAHAGSRRGEIRARRRHLTPAEIVIVDGLPVTSLARTWIDLAESLSCPDLVAVGDSALRSGVTPEALESSTKRAVHRRGVVRARACLPYLDARSRSRPESHLRYAIVSSGLPKPEVNKPIHDDYGGWLAEPDLSYADVKLALEYDGADHAETERMRRDITRAVDVALRGGWRSVSFGPAQVFTRPDEAATLVRHLRLERADLALTTYDPWSQSD